jgi:hypothetical protein
LELSRASANAAGAVVNAITAKLNSAAVAERRRRTDFRKRV